MPPDTAIEQVFAVGPGGAVALNVDQNDAVRPCIYREGRLSNFETLESSLFRFSGDETPGYRITGFLPDGSVYGAGFCGTSGATLMTESRAFIAPKLIMQVVHLPDELKTWEHSIVRAVRSDGAVLLEVKENGFTFNLDDPSAEAERLIWVKEGKLLQDLGPAAEPIFDRDGNIYARQCRDPHGQPVAPNLGPFQEYVVTWKQGRAQIICEGWPVAFWADGSMIFSRRPPFAAESDGSLIPGNRALAKFFVLPSGSSSPASLSTVFPQTEVVLAGPETVVLIGSDGPERFAQFMTAKGKRIVPVPNGLDFEVVGYGWAVLRERGERKNARRFLSKLP